MTYVVATVIWLVALVKFAYAPGSPRWDMARRGGWFAGFSLSTAYPLLAFTQMSTLTSLDVTGTLALWTWMLLGLLAVICLHTVNLGMALSAPENKQTFAWAFQIGATLFCVVVAIAALGISAKLHDALMQMSSVRIPHVHIVVQKSTCDALRLAGVSASRYAELPGASVAETCILTDVTVLSRLGAQWRIACQRDTEAEVSYKGFNIDANAVIALVDVLKPVKTNRPPNNVCQGMWAP
ncbi:MAG: hypothetical protein EOP36_01180 [Rubrivivax sp.]|nr:MAG: hypothetical protein EOP36_01180 [Rubrivivax sp.]